MMFTLVTILGRAAKSLFFGPLRDIEVEHMYDRSWTALVEMCIAMTIFREEFSVRFVALVTVLFFLKIFHWLTQHRLEYIEQAYHQLPRSAHFRIVSLMVLLMAVDAGFVFLSVTQTLKKGPSVLLLFAFEYMVLLSMMLSLGIKYIIHIMDMRREGRWDNKGTYVFYLQLVTDLFQLFVYMIFFLIICAYYGLPFHIIRDLYLTYTNFKKRITQYLQYRRLTRVLHTFPDVGPDEIAQGDSTCIICRDEMTSAKRLPCGHFFHYHCLRTWLEQHASCPYCRTSITAPPADRTPRAPPQAVDGAGGANAPMPDLQMPPAAAAAAAVHAAAAGGAGTQHNGMPGAPQPTGVAAAPGMSSGFLSGYTMPVSPMGQPGTGGMPVLSDEMLKVHIEWQIASLQSLLTQVEARQASKKKSAAAVKVEGGDVSSQEAAVDEKAPPAADTEDVTSSSDGQRQGRTLRDD